MVGYSEIMSNVKNLRPGPVETSSKSSKPKRTTVKSDEDPFESVLGQHFDSNPNTAKLMLVRISQKHSTSEAE